MDINVIASSSFFACANNGINFLKFSHTFSYFMKINRSVYSLVGW
jgi:hypothetical protein